MSLKDSDLERYQQLLVSRLAGRVQLGYSREQALSALLARTVEQLAAPEQERAERAAEDIDGLYVEFIELIEMGAQPLPNTLALLHAGWPEGNDRFVPTGAESIVGALAVRERPFLPRSDQAKRERVLCRLQAWGLPLDAPNTETGKTPLQHAINWFGGFETAQALLRCGVDPAALPPSAVCSPMSVIEQRLAGDLINTEHASALLAMMQATCARLAVERSLAAAPECRP